MTPATENTRLVVLPHSITHRRILGPLAWAALETLALSAHEDDGLVVAEASVRALASVLGVGKESVAATLRRIAERGLIRPGQHRHAGRFTGSVYALNLDALEEVGLVLEQLGQEPRPEAPRPFPPCPVEPCPDPPVTVTQNTVETVAPAGRSAVGRVRPSDPTPSLFDLAATPTPFPNPDPSLPDPTPTSPSYAQPRPSVPPLLPQPSTLHIRPDALAPGVPGGAVSVLGNLNGNLNEAGQC